MNDCTHCLFHRRYEGAETHWCRRTGIHIEGQVAKLDGVWMDLPHEPAPAWCPGMKELDDEI